MHEFEYKCVIRDYMHVSINMCTAQCAEIIRKFDSSVPEVYMYTYVHRVPWKNIHVTYMHLIKVALI